MAATRVLAEAAGPPVDLPGLETPADHPDRPAARGRQPPRFPLARAARAADRRASPATSASTRSARLASLLAVTPSMSPWRAIVIDSADDLEASAANALLKMLEEPPANTLFFLVSHAPGPLAADDPLALPPAGLRAT